jgi:DNA topoisomerase-1
VEDRANRLPYLFRAVGRLLVFDGFLKVYEEGRDPGEEPEDGGPLPHLHPGEPLDLLELIPKQHWTQPPPRYTEASLIKELEKRGIGRPSTFAGMVDLIQDRGYVDKEQRFLKPTPLGFAVCDLLVGFFPDLFDYGFTAQMEDTLDEIAGGRAERLATLEAFWAGLEPALLKAGAEMPKVQVETPPAPAKRASRTAKAVTPTSKTCPQCGGGLVQRKGKYGPFVGCSNYPKCRYIEKTTGKKKTTDVKSE